MMLHVSSFWVLRLALLAAALSGNYLTGCVENSLPANEETPPLPAPEKPAPVKRRSAAGKRRSGPPVGTIRLAAEETRKTSTAAASSPQQPKDDPAKPQPRYSHRQQHDRNGIGKFYMGREIAHFMNAAAAPWLERPEREQEESLSKLVPALKIQPGMVVADIGAGSGVITVMISEKVGTEGRVIAVDIQKPMLDLLAKKLKQRKIDNVVLVEGTVKSPKLNANTIDLAIMVDVYHEFAFPYEMLENISQSLKPGGRVAFVEYRREDPNVPIKLVHKMSEAQVKLEASHPEFRLKWKETVPDLPWQHIVVFERLPEEKSSTPSKK